MRLILELAVFILATTRFFQKESSWDARVLPTFNTWGRSIEHLYFVFGTNQFDQDFLVKNCHVDNEPSSNNLAAYGSSSALSFSFADRLGQNQRRLVANFRQTPLENKTVLYRCSGDIVKMSPDPASASLLPPRPQTSYLKALWTANCTGEYFGVGPTCRCQESYRYLLYSPKFKDVNWFLFMDDDVYIRPFSLMALLNQFQLKAGSPEVAILSSAVYRGFGFSKYWSQYNRRNNISDKDIDCKVDGVHSYAIAMPGLINKRALELMTPAIDANAMTELHSIWGGSHDAILGLLFWLYRIDTYSVANIYIDRKSLSVDILNRVDKNASIFVHRVKNFTFSPKLRITKSKATETKQSLPTKYGPSAYHLYSYFRDWTEEDLPEEVLRRGERGYSSLIKLVESGVHKTVFAPKALEMRSSKRYFTYYFTDCMLI